MKKFLPLLLLLVTSVFIFSCKDDNDDVQVNVDYPAVYDLKNVNFTYNQNDGWNYFQSFTRPMLSQDIVLIYLQTDTTSNGNPVWTALPAKFNPAVGEEVYYDFDFTVNDFKIYTRATFDLSQQASLYLNNKTFRVVLVPAVFGNKNTNATDIHKMTYEEVIKKYNINDSKVGTL
jgi:hypothetical protein